MKRSIVKRQVVIGALLALIASGVHGAWAGDPGQGQKGVDGRLARMTRVLGLSDAQQTQIKAIFTAEREKDAPLMEKMAAYRKQLHETAHSGTFDEAAVRAIASNRAQVEIELTVSRARVQSQINAVLTPEQRALAERLQPPVEERGPGHRPHFGGEE